MSADTLKADSHLFDVRPATAWMNDVQKAILVGGAKHFRGANPPRGTQISYWLKEPAAGDVKISIVNVQGTEVRTMDGSKTAGLNRVTWDLGGNPPPGAAALAGRFGGRGRGSLNPPLPPGQYLVRVSVAGKEIGSKTITVEPDTLD
jgi:hypothetical protein